MAQPAEARTGNARLIEGWVFGGSNPRVSEAFLSVPPAMAMESKPSGARDEGQYRER